MLCWVGLRKSHFVSFPRIIRLMAVLTTEEKEKKKKKKKETKEYTMSIVIGRIALTMFSSRFFLFSLIGPWHVFINHHFPKRSFLQDEDEEEDEEEEKRILCKEDGYLTTRQ